MRLFCAAMLLGLLMWQAPATEAVAEPPPINPMPAVPVTVPGSAPNNHAATPSQPAFGLLPLPGPGTQVSAGFEAGHSARISGGMTGGRLEDPWGISEGTAR
ncbi:hypothetical protein [Mycobacteroides chelonae]